MLAQRIQLGLAESVQPQLVRSIRVLPVVGIGHGYNPVALDRLRVVRDRLAEQGADEPPVEVFDVDLSGAFARVAR
jgi:hypothetical protein